MKLSDLLAVFRRRAERVDPARDETPEREPGDEEISLGPTGPLGPTGGQVGNPQRF